MENGAVSHLSSSASIRQNSHHYMPLLMTNGSKMSSSMFSYMGSDSKTDSRESELISTGKDTINDPPSIPALHTKSVVTEQGPRQSNGTVSEQLKKPSVNSIPNSQPLSTTTMDSIPTTRLTKDVVKESSRDAPSATTSSTPSSKVPPADLIDGALSDFDGSDLSDLSSPSSASASDQDAAGNSEDDSSMEDNANEESKDSDEGGDDSMNNQSASDDSGPRSISRRTKGSMAKNKSRPKHRRRIESDSSNGEEERQVVKRGPGRPPKLKKNPARPTARSSPTSPVSPTFSSQAKKSGADMEHQPNSEPQPKKKVRQADFTNVGKRDRSGRTQLFKYTALGDLETCRKLIEAGAEVNDRDYAEWTPLHEACVTGHDKVAELLIQHKADVNARGGHMDTPLHDAAQNGHVEVVKLLLSNGANVLAKNAKGVIPIDVTDDKEVIDLLQRRQTLVNMLTGKNQAGQTLLHRACSSGSYNNVLELLNQGADINAQDNAQWTPLHEAALEGHTKVVELLLSRGANPNARGHGDDTALHDSAQNEHLEVVRLLLEYGADPDFKNSKGDKPCDVTEDEDILELLKTGARGTKKPIQNSTGSQIISSSSSSVSSFPSKTAGSSNSLGTNRGDKTSRCKEGGADVNMSDEGRSAGEERAPMSRDERKMQQLLSTIRMQERREERKKAKKRLAKAASDDEAEDDNHDSKPQSSRSSNSASSIWKQPHSNGKYSKASHTPSRSKIKNGPKGRLSRSEDREDSDSEPERLRQSRRSVQRSAGDRCRIDHRFKDAAGRSQLHLWAESGDIEMVGTLLEGGAERDPRDHEGLTPLHLAAKAGNTEVLVLLLAYGCSVNAQDQEKATALHEAVRNHHVEAVRLLLQNNALVSLRDSKKRTCLDLVSSKDSEIRSLLKSAMEQAELKSKERSKKRLSQSIESHGSPKHKERKTSRQSDNDEPVKTKKKDSDRKDNEEGKQHSRSGSTSSLSKSISMPLIAASQSRPVSPNTTSLTNTATATSSAWKYSSEDNKDGIITPLKKQKLHSRHMSSSGTSSSIQEGDGDIEMKSSISSKKRRESDRHNDGYGGRVKIKKEREEEGQPLRIQNLSAKMDDLRRVASLPSFSKENISNSSSNSTKLNRHASKPSLSSSTKPPLGMNAGSSIASISPPLTETSSSPPPTSAQSLAAQELDAQRSRKRSSQIFTSPSGYQKFADELKLGGGTPASGSQHHRQRSTSSISSSRTTTTSSTAISSTTTATAASKIDAGPMTDVDISRKKAKTSASESLIVEQQSGNKSSVKGAAIANGPLTGNSKSLTSSGVAVFEEGGADSRGVEKIKKEESVENHVPSQRSIQEAQRYLPLYTVQLSGDGTDHESTKSASTSSLSSTSTNDTSSQHFSVVDRQVQLLLGLTQDALYKRYPHLHRRLINKREKARLWSPLSSMVSDRCAAAVKLNFEVLPVECQFSSLTNAATAMSRLKEHEKQKFLNCELYFIQLEEVLDVIRRDYAHLDDSMMTITVDIGYDEEFETGMDVEEESMSGLSSVKVEEEMEVVKLKEVKEDDENEKTEVGTRKEIRSQFTSTSISASTSISTSTVLASSNGPESFPSAATSGGYIHKLRRVPAKMATKAMFKEMQQHFRSS
ncbi:hypothetical protein BGZ79_005038 [Entomortierella chlamydospora]|nr:hypothetical protein BGZ79_005038 [Entomortierella chlamydospora]